MLQAAILDCLFLDLFPFSENVFVTSEVDVCRSDVVQALVITVVVVVIDEGTDLLLQIAWQVVVFQENPVLHGLFLTKEQRYEIATRAAIEEVCWHAGYAGFPIYKPLV